MTRIAILSQSFAPADAVSNDVVGMFNTLVSRGHDARIYAEGSALDEPKVWPANQIDRYLKSSSDLLIYHCATGWEFGLKLLRELKCLTAVRYHNITPPEFFERYSPDFARQCREGRNQLSSIASANCDLYMSDSQFNAQDLLTAGVPESKSFIVPPFHQIDRLHSIEPDQETLDRYQDNLTNILMVGRVVPNKGHAALLEAFAAYHHDYNRNSRLIIVGKEEMRFQVYNSLLREMGRILRVADNVIFAGEVSDSVLKAHYLAADVFLITSEHEGFCVPLVEAMAMKVPVVAYDSSAIPETIGKSGIIWKERNPYLLAESVHRIVSDEAIGFALRAMGWQRFEQCYSNEKIAQRFTEALDRLL